MNIVSSSGAKTSAVIPDVIGNHTVCMAVIYPEYAGTIAEGLTKLADIVELLDSDENAYFGRTIESVVLTNDGTVLAIEAAASEPFLIPIERRENRIYFGNASDVSEADGRGRSVALMVNVAKEGM